MPIKVNITLDDTRVRNAFNRLLQAGDDLSPAMRAIGEHILNITRERFNDQQDPDGKPWAPLSEATLARKRKNTDKILTERGYLRGNLTYRADRNSVEVGSPNIYAGVHQFGAKKGAFGKTSRGGPIPWGDIPARPFLGIDTKDQPAVEDIIRNFIQSKWTQP